MKRLVLDVILSGILTACLIALQNWEWRPPTSDFVASYNHVIWGIFTGLFFTLISIFAWNVLTGPRIVLPRLFEITAVLLVAHALASLFYVLRHRSEDVGTVIGFGVVFTLVPALIASIGSFLLVTIVARLVSASPR